MEALFGPTLLQFFMSQGLLGVIVAFLLWYCLRQEKKIEDLRAVH